MEFQSPKEGMDMDDHRAHARKQPADTAAADTHMTHAHPAGRDTRPDPLVTPASPDSAHQTHKTLAGEPAIHNGHNATAAGRPAHTGHVDHTGHEETFRRLVYLNRRRRDGEAADFEDR